MVLGTMPRKERERNKAIWVENGLWCNLSRLFISLQFYKFCCLKVFVKISTSVTSSSMVFTSSIDFFAALLPQRMKCWISTTEMNIPVKIFEIFPFISQQEYLLCFWIQWYTLNGIQFCHKIWFITYEIIYHWDILW